MHAARVSCMHGAIVDPPPGSSEPDFFQHAQKCPQLAAARSACHSILCGTWCQVMQSAGVPTSLEPNCSKVAGSNPVILAGARADILCVLQDRLRLSDVSVTHCCADTYVDTAAATAGSAAEGRAAISRMCAARGPCAPAVGAVPLCLWLVPRWHRVRCDVCVCAVCWLDACAVAWLGDCRL